MGEDLISRIEEILARWDAAAAGSPAYQGCANQLACLVANNRDAVLSALRPTPSSNEAVAWMYEKEDGERTFEFNPNGESARWLLENGYVETPLYAHPPATSSGVASDDEVEAVARAIAKELGANWGAATFLETPGGEEPEDMREGFRRLAIAALKAKP